MRRLGGYTKKPSAIKNLDATTNKDVQKTTTVATPSVEVGQEVQCEYNGVPVSGFVRYIGATDFSPGKWCGIELKEDIGKHNGTVNGKCYFTCKESYGVFVRYNKVAERLSPKGTSEQVAKSPTTDSPSSENSTPLSRVPTLTKSPSHQTTAEDPDMRITVKSIKSTPLPTSVRIENANIKSSVKSLIKNKKDKKLTTKELLNGIRKEKVKATVIETVTAQNVVVSSFTAPVPVQPVVVSPQESMTDDDAATLSPDTEYDTDTFLLNNISPEETSTDVDTTGNTEESLEPATDSVVSSSVENGINPTTPDTETENDSDLLSECDESQRGDDSEACSEMTSSSRIPRRIKSISRTPPHPAAAQNGESATTLERPAKQNLETTSTAATIKSTKTSRDQRRNSESDKSTTSIPVRDNEKPASLAAKTPFRSSKRNLDFNRGILNNKLNEEKSKQNGGKTNELEKHTSQFKATTPSLARKSVSTPFTARKAPTPVLPRKGSASIGSKIQPPRSLSIKENKKDALIEETGKITFSFSFTLLYFSLLFVFFLQLDLHPKNSFTKLGSNIVLFLFIFLVSCSSKSILFKLN